MNMTIQEALELIDAINEAIVAAKAQGTDVVTIGGALDDLARSDLQDAINNTSK